MTTVSIPHTDVAGEPFPAARFIKEIGRGKNGARSMKRDDACALYRAMLDGRVSDLELGGILLSMRIKGESVDEIAGFLDAAEASFAPLQAPAGPYAPIVSPSYNGARKMANLTALLALLLARAGAPVLVHGVTLDVGRVTTAEVLLRWAFPPATAMSKRKTPWRAARWPSCRLPPWRQNCLICCRCAAYWACAIPPIPW